MTYPDSSKIKSIYTSLTLEKNDLNDSLVYANESVGIASSNINVYQIPPAALDKVVLQKIDLINSKKQQIVTLLTNNFNSRGCGIGSATGSIVSNVVVVGSAATFYYDCSPLCSIGVSARVTQDVLYAWNYPALETYNNNVPIPQENGVRTKVTLSNLGIGKTSLFYNDQNDPLGIMSTSTFIGYYYPITGVGASCTQIINQVTDLENEIIGIRSDINQLLPSINILKDRKTEEQLTAFYENRSVTDTQQRVSGISSALSVLDQYKTDIINYENSLSSTSTYLNKTGNYTYGA